jgi:hypothetical protein
MMFVARGNVLGNVGEIGGRRVDYKMRNTLAAGWGE